jgi:hypothetical protein
MRRFCLFFLVLLSFCSIPTISRADWTPRVELKGTEVLVNGIRILQSRKSLGGVAPAGRAQIAAERLAELTKAGLSPKQITVDIDREKIIKHVVRRVEFPVETSVTKRVPTYRTVNVDREVKVSVEREVKVKRKRKWVTVSRTVNVTKTISVPKTITEYVTKTFPKWVMRSEKKTFEVIDYNETQAKLMGDGKIIAVASEADAVAAKLVKPHELAGSWRESLQKALSLPGLAINSETGEQTVPVAEGRPLTFRGAARGAVQVAFQNFEEAESPVRVTINEKKRTIRLEGVRPGKETIILTEEGATAKINVTVKKYAAKLDKPRPLVLTGQGVSGKFIAPYLEPHILQLIHEEPGATVRVGKPSTLPTRLLPNAIQSVAVPVAIEGPDMLTVERVLNIPLTLKDVPRDSRETLLYSNNPERVSKPQTLHASRVPAGMVRVLYHHLSNLPERAVFTAEIINDGKEAVQIQIGATTQEPLADPTLVGFRATAEFFPLLESGTGAVVGIAPGQRIAFVRAEFDPGLTISGLAQLRIVSGPAPLLRIAVSAPDNPTLIPHLWHDYLAPAEMLAEARESAKIETHVYPNPVKKVTERYQVGGKFSFVSIGRVPIKSLTSQQLDGNYGVLYDITLSLINQTDEPETISLRFEPSGGLAGAFMLIDGKPVEIMRTNMPEETTLATYKLMPKEIREVKIRTMPLAGSNYPARIIVSP